MATRRLALPVVGGALFLACNGSSPAAPGTSDGSSPTPQDAAALADGAAPVRDEKDSAPATDGGARTFRVDAWADNWFAAYSGETLIGQDSVPITTERSFNKETFTFSGTYPLSLGFVLQDFKQDDSGLEYIGTPRQQMGDGGFIAQITEVATGRVVGVSGAHWRCLVIHKAPLDVSCEKAPVPIQTCTRSVLTEPAGWRRVDYDTSGWEAASEYTEAEVGTKEGYAEVLWDPSAKLVWTSSLKQDNTLLCKVTIAAP